MAKKDEFKYDIVKFVGSVSESDTSEWCKAVLKMTWGDNPSTLDIRRVKVEDGNYIPTKGIALTDVEADKLVELLLDEGYGTLESLEKALSKKRKFFTLSTEDEPEMCEDDEFEKFFDYTLGDD